MNVPPESFVLSLVCCKQSVVLQRPLRSMSVMNRVNKKARGAAPNNMMGMMPHMMMPQMMQMGLPMGPMMGMMQQPAAGEDDHDSEEEESRAMAAVPKANPPTVSSACSSDVSGAGAEGGLQEDGVTHHQKLPDALISRSVTYIKQLPRNRMSETLEAVDSTLDASFTSELSVSGCLMMLWLYCRIKPSVKVSDLSTLAHLTLSYFTQLGGFDQTVMLFNVNWIGKQTNKHVK